MRRAALIAGSDFVYGMMRMYESYAAGADIYVCRSRAEAIAWLGILDFS